MAGVYRLPEICGFCQKGREAEILCGKLWVDTKAAIAAHRKCMQYSASLVEYRQSQFGGFHVNEVVKEIERGRRLHCAICTKGKKQNRKTGKTNGASCGCAISNCKQSFHYDCALSSKSAVVRRYRRFNEDGSEVVYFRIFCDFKHEDKYVKQNLRGRNYQVESPNSSETSPPPILRPDALKHTSYYDALGYIPSPVPSPTVERRSSLELDELDNYSLPSPNLPHSSSSNSSMHAAMMNEEHTDSMLLEDKEDNEEERDAFDNNRTAASPTEVLHNEEEEEEEGSYEEEQARKKRRLHDSADSSLEIAHEPTIIMQRLREQANPDDCVICIYEHPINDHVGGDGDMAQDLEAILQKMAQCVYGVPEAAVFVWQWPNGIVQPKHMLYYIADISKQLSRSHERIEHYLCDLSLEECTQYISKITEQQKLSEEVQKQKRKELQKKIDQYLLVSTATLKEEVACFLPVDKISGGCALFLRLCHLIDPAHNLRSRLGYTANLEQWNEQSMLVGRDTLPYRGYEKDTLLMYLGRNVNNPQILFYPTEEVFQQNKQQARFSTTYKLKQEYLKKQSISQSNNLLVFLGPVNTDVIRFSAYVKEMLKRLIKERVQPYSQLYCVLDVGQNTRINGFADIIPRQLDPHADLSVWSAWNPCRAQVSAVLVKITFRTAPSLQNGSAMIDRRFYQPA